MVDIDRGLDSTLGTDEVLGPNLEVNFDFDSSSADVFSLCSFLPKMAFCLCSLLSLERL